MKLNLLFPFLLGLLLSFSLIFSQDRLIPLLLQVLDYYATSMTKVKFTFVIYFIGGSIASLSSFYLLQKWKGRTNILIGLSGALLNAILVFLSKNEYVFLASRALEGFGIQLVANTMGAIVASVFNGINPITFFKRHSVFLNSAQVFSLGNGMMAISGISIPVLSAVMGETYGWKSLYFLFILLTLAMLWLCIQSPWSKIEPMITQEQDLSFKEKLTKLSKSYFFLIYSLIGSTTTVLIIFQIISFPILFLDNLQLKPVHFGLLALMLGLVSVTSTSICLRFAKKHQELLRKLSIFSTLCFSLWLFIWNYYDLHLVSLILPVAMLSLSLEIFTPLITAKIYACHQENVKLASSFYNSLQMFACIIGSVLASLIETHLFRNVFMCSMVLTFFITISYLITSKREQNLLQGRS